MRSAEFSISVHHLTETGLEHAFVVDGGVSKMVLFCFGFGFKKKVYLCTSFYTKQKKKADNTDRVLFLGWE